MKTTKKDLLFTAFLFLIILLSVVWSGIDYESQDDIWKRIFVTLFIIQTVCLFFLQGDRYGRGDYLLLENIKKGTFFKVISSLEIPNKKLNCFYVIELQNGKFSILSLKKEGDVDPNSALCVGKSYFVNSESGKLLMVV